MTDSHRPNQSNGSPNGSGEDRLMHGENILSRSPDDITHWIMAYQELLAFKDRLLADMKQGMTALSKPASAEIQELDVNLIELQRQRYVRRLDFWLNRQTEISREARSPF